MKEALEVLQALQGTSIPNLLVIAGLLLVLLGFAGKIGAIIELTPQRQKVAGFFGFVLLAFGIGLFVLPPSATNQETPPTQPVVPSQISPTDLPIAISTTEAPKIPTATNPPPPTAYFTYEIDYSGPIEIHGGGGEGGNEMYASCPTGYVATGLVGGAGEYIDRIGLQCSWLEHNGTTGDTLLTEMYGGGGGTEFLLACPASQLLVAVSGGAGLYVDRVSGHCESIDGMRSFDSSPAGGSGGDSFSANCPTGYAVTAIRGGSGAWVDRMNFICNKINKIRH